MVLRLPDWPKVPVTKLKGQALSTTLVLACIKKGIIVIKAYVPSRLSPLWRADR